MRYTLEINIDLPRDEVVAIFDNPDDMKHWQKGFVCLEHISGSPGEEGAVSKLIYKMRKRDMELIEHLLKRDLPQAFHATYDTKGVHSIQENYFEEIDENHTKWISVSEFRFSGFFMKTMGLLMPGAFKKQSLKFMEDFKNFAEKGLSVTQQS